MIKTIINHYKNQNKYRDIFKKYYKLEMDNILDSCYNNYEKSIRIINLQHYKDNIIYNESFYKTHLFLIKCIEDNKR